LEAYRFLSRTTVQIAAVTRVSAETVGSIGARNKALASKAEE
jgi:hypothetical protein